MSKKRPLKQDWTDVVWVCRGLASALQGEQHILSAVDRLSTGAPAGARRLLNACRTRLRAADPHWVSDGMVETGLPAFLSEVAHMGDARAKPAEALGALADRLETELALKAPRDRELYAWALALGRLGLMVEIGVPILTALKSAAESVSESRACDGLSAAVGSVKGGAALSDALGRVAPELPPMTMEMIRDGETDGRLGKALPIVADYLLDAAAEVTGKASRR